MGVVSVIWLGESGNITTRNIQGFDMTLMTGSVMLGVYVTGLAGYYLLILRFNYTEARIAKCYEKILHALGVGYTFRVAIIYWATIQRNQILVGAGRKAIRMTVRFLRMSPVSVRILFFLQMIPAIIILIAIAVFTTMVCLGVCAYQLKASRHLNCDIDKSKVLDTSIQALLFVLAFLFSSVGISGTSWARQAVNAASTARPIKCTTSSLPYGTNCFSRSLAFGTF